MEDAKHNHFVRATIERRLGASRDLVTAIMHASVRKYQHATGAQCVRQIPFPSSFKLFKRAALPQFRMFAGIKRMHFFL